MKRKARIAVLLGAVALLSGAPAYLALDHLRLLPPDLRDRPWPLGALGLALIGVVLVLARRCAEKKERRIVLASAILGAVSVVSVSGLASAAYALPRSEFPTGGRLPDLSLPDETGRPVSLASLRGQPTVLIFYRGAFCAYCRNELVRFSEQASAFMAHGVRILAVSADPPNVAITLKRTLGIPFRLLSDETQRLTVELCGVNAHCVVIADDNQVVRWGGLNDDWRTKVEPEVVFQAAYRSDSL